MSRYIRPRAPGACVFVTATLAERGAGGLVEQVHHLRAAVRETRDARPFGIDAFVVLPDHFHALMRLPEGYADFSKRIGAIKARFTMKLRRAGFRPPVSCDHWERFSQAEARSDLSVISVEKT